jgi:hypothetical protein
LERRRYPVPHSKAERGCVPLQSGRLAKYNPVIEDAWFSAGGQEPSYVEGDDDG